MNISPETSKRINNWAPCCMPFTKIVTVSRRVEFNIDPSVSLVAPQRPIIIRALCLSLTLPLVCQPYASQAFLSPARTMYKMNSSWSTEATPALRNCCDKCSAEDTVELKPAILLSSRYYYRLIYNLGNWRYLGDSDSFILLTIPGKPSARVIL